MGTLRDGLPDRLNGHRLWSRRSGNQGSAAGWVLVLVIGNPPDAAQLGCTWPSADTREERNLPSRPVIRMILTSDGLGEATPNGQPFCFA